MQGTNGQQLSIAIAINVRYTVRHSLYGIGVTMKPLPLSERWLTHFMRMCQLVSTMSKDPSTQVGAVIVRPNRTIASTGYNGYPRPCIDDDYINRERKYRRIIHAEMNAILSAREPLNECTLFTWPIASCDRCIPHIIQSGIKQLVIPSIHQSHRWAQSCLEAQSMAREANRSG